MASETLVSDPAAVSPPPLRPYEAPPRGPVRPPPKGDGVPWVIMNHPPNVKIFFRSGFGVVYQSREHPERLCKVPLPLKSYLAMHETERRIFTRLGEHGGHPNLVRVTGMDDHGIWMERALYGCLRVFYDQNGGPSAVPVPLATRLQWCEDVARVLSFVHSHGVRHADLSGRNLLVDADMRILLCDFSGSAIDDQKAAISAEAGYRYPSETDEDRFPSMRSELHALGSTLYEIVAAQEVHAGQAKEVVEQLIKDGKYPDVADLALSTVIQKCWRGEYTSADEVANAIAECREAGATRV
ncbi:Protein kinase-like domain protein [Niveomyces insectorum RCEF 264]|uniref:EKC/KEOPS complex subunit BUD32 n=1 Tax=Niveomyces insectorum RCEF 264 TaxID=1081102 RepID=A0A167TGD4_9HYPO|nr:Protein kinase-like domain protein [Niveomyces insectorum RCEF 264]